MLHTLSHRGRKHLLEGLHNLAPAAMAMSDRSILANISHPTQNVKVAKSGWTGGSIRVKIYGFYQRSNYTCNSEPETLILRLR